MIIEFAKIHKYADSRNSRRYRFGKTTVVKKVMEAFPNNEVIVIPQDSYYRDNSDIPLEERQKINFDHPDSVEFSLLIDHLKQLKKGKSS